MLEIGAQEGSNMGPGLGNDEVVYIEELGHAGKRGVTLIEGMGRGDVLGLESQGLGVRLRPGHYLPCLVFAEEGHGLVERVRGGVGGERGGPDQDVGSGEVVEQIGHAAAAGGGDGDIEDAVCAGAGFFEGEVAYVGADAFFKDVDVQEVAFADEPGGAAKEGL